MSKDTTFYRRNLPHYHPPDAIFFVTFRLANSHPTHIIHSIKTELNHKQEQLQSKNKSINISEEYYRLQKQNFAKYDTWLDQCAYGPKWLADDGIARIVSENIVALDSKNYQLLAYCIMSNHVHLLVDLYRFQKVSKSNKDGTTKDYPLSDTLRLLKGRTARFCNQFLSRSGAFWANESYDHVVRDNAELERIVWYIINNPVKAGLVARWEEWAFTYVVDEFFV